VPAAKLALGPARYVDGVPLVDDGGLTLGCA
jgi:hypothetical protein